MPLGQIKDIEMKNKLNDPNIPNTLSWFIASLLAGKRKFLPFLNK
jgi:hypothetical protein